MKKLYRNIAGVSFALEKNMRTLVILSLLLMSMAVWGLNYEPGSGLNVGSGERENEAKFHSGDDDRHFYYSYPEASDHRWAVKFDFRSYYSGIDSLNFAPESALIYLPNLTTSGQLTVGLYHNEALGPGELIVENSLPASQLVSGWNEIELSTTADTLFWLVIDYPTGLGNQQYISASNGDGSHSYFWDPYYGADGTWLNMSANGFNNEFLFTLTGEFFFFDLDLEIADFTIEGEFAPGEEITASAVLRNNYYSSVDSVTVIFKKEYPGNIENDTLLVSEIGAGEELQLPETGEINYVLGTPPGQYKFTVTLFRSGDSVTENNSKVINRNTFNFERAEILIENMVELEDNYSNGIWATQAGITEFQLLPINYFPSYQDEIYYNALAEVRFHYYGLYNLPATVIAGDPLIGYQAGFYETQLLAVCEEAVSGNSFVEIADVEGLVDTLENVYVSVTLSRGSNQILSAFAPNCHLYGLIYEEGLVLNDQYSGKVFLDTLEFAVPGLSGLANAETVTKHTVFNQLYKFTPISEDLYNCHLLFWVQNINDNVVWATGQLAFSDFGIVDNDHDEISPINRIYAYPNPYDLVGSMQIKLPDELRDSDVTINIYNIKGQLVRRLSEGELTWNGLDSRQQEAGNGIYFLQLDQAQRSDWIKIMVIK